MGSKYPSIKSSEVVKRLKQFDFVFVSQKGSHAKYVKKAVGLPTRTAIIPMHDEISKGTLRKILLQHTPTSLKTKPKILVG
jgi:predicted RNA binding protein YcfA (HicA-like mRNA interferase family)